MNIILYAIPVFFLLIAIELVLEKRRGTEFYRTNDAINSLSAGVLSRMTGILRQFLPFTLYVLVYQHFAQFELPATALTWLVAFVLYDFLYYWNHRLGHEVSVLWAAHVVHHSSEEYNLTTALRQTSGNLLNWVFYLPMAVIGFDPMMLITVASLNLVYQFWVHTRHIGKLGWFEWFFVSPSNHRVHHAQNSLYIDRNYGGVFILWDRLFGTFQEEMANEKPIYGIRKALHSWNPLWANLQVYSQLVKDSWYTRRWRDKFRVWFGRTGWRPDDVSQSHPLPPTDLSRFRKYDIELSTATKSYCLLQHGITVIFGVSLMLFAGNLLWWQQVALACFVIFSCVSVGWMLEARPFAIKLEWLKNFMVVAMLLVVELPGWLSLTVWSLSLIAIAILFVVTRNPGQPSAPSDGELATDT